MFCNKRKLSISFELSFALVIQNECLIPFTHVSVCWKLTDKPSFTKTLGLSCTRRLCGHITDSFKVNHDLANIKQWLSANKLSLNLVKIEYLLIGSRHTINNLFHAPKVHVGDIPVKRGRETKALGAYIDEFLSWNYIEVILKKNLIQH